MMFEELYVNSPDDFFEELRSELRYYQRTKIITMLDIYRIRKKTLPLLDVWFSARDKVFESILNSYENLLMLAIRDEPSLSDVTALTNENKYVLRNCMRLFMDTLPIV